MNYSELSYSITKNITKQEKKSNGIYFTPPSTVKLNIELLKNYMSSIHTILEPSCGSCEYINYIYENYNSKTECGTAGGSWESNAEEIKIFGPDPYADISDPHPAIGFRVVIALGSLSK